MYVRGVAISVVHVIRSTLVDFFAYGRPGFYFSHCAPALYAFSTQHLRIDSRYSYSRYREMKDIRSRWPGLSPTTAAIVVCTHPVVCVDALSPQPERQFPTPLCSAPSFFLLWSHESLNIDPVGVMYFGNHGIPITYLWTPEKARESDETSRKGTGCTLRVWRMHATTAVSVK